MASLAGMIRPFRMISIGKDGFREEISSDAMNKKIEEWTKLTSQVDSLTCIDLPRGSDVVSLIVALVQKEVPFIFRPVGGKSTELPANWLIQAKQIVRIGCQEAPLPAGHCYSIRTSGTTGTAKMVHVATHCIAHNIRDFSRRFEVSPQDSVLCSTSFFFDPSIVELFLSMTTGATLILVDDGIRTASYRLGDVIEQEMPTIVQLTPAVLSLLPPRTLSWILGDSSPVRILLIGGDKFPLHLIDKYRSRANRTRIFDVYGITEVSCWASVFEVEHGCSEVFVGDPIEGTYFELSAKQELLIGGLRCCQPGDISTRSTVPTGDVIESVGKRWRIIGRTDDQVKINGIRCSLSTMSEKLLSLADDLPFARFVYWKKSFLVLFLRSPAPLSDDVITEVCPATLRPATVKYVDTVPLNTSGKVDVSQLVRLLENNDEIEKTARFWRILARHGISQEDERALSRTFVDYGVTSSTATEIAVLLGDVGVLVDILSSKIDINTIFNRYLSGALEQKEAACCQLPPPVPLFVREVPPSDVLWAYCTGKCIDGSPLIVDYNGGSRVVIASHSGRVACISHPQGVVVWQINLPTRFEASPVRCAEMAVLGGYNGVVYFISISTGDVIWSFGTKEQIKAAAAIDNEMVYVISYDRRLYKLDSRSAVPIWSSPVTAGSPSDVIILENLVVCSTIKGTVEAFRKENGQSVWCFQCPSPVFSSPIRDDDVIIVTSVDGTVSRIGMYKGERVNSVCVSEVLFAPVFILTDVILASSQKGSIFVLDRRSLRVSRHFTLSGCVFVKSPFYFSADEIGFTSTDGSLVVIHIEHLDSPATASSRIPLRFRVCPRGGQVFSVPRVASDSNHLLVGSRDDWLRCLRK